MLGSDMDYRGSVDNLYRNSSSHNDHPEDRYRSNFSSHMEKSQSMTTLPTRHSKFGFSYLPNSTSPPRRDERPPLRQSDHATSSFNERPSSRQSDRFSSHYDERPSSRFSDLGSSRMSDYAPENDRYASRDSRRGSFMSRASTPSSEREYSYERTSSLYDNSAPSMHDRGPLSVERESSPGRGSEFSSHSYHRGESSSGQGYDSRKSLRDDSDHFQKYHNSGFGNGLLSNDYDHSSPDTLTGTNTHTGSNTYGSGKYKTVNGSKHSYNDRSLLSDRSQSSFDTGGSDKGSRSYSTLPSRSESKGDDFYKSTLRKTTYEATRDGRSSPMVNGSLSKSSESAGDDFFKSSSKRSTYESPRDRSSPPTVNGTLPRGYGSADDDFYKSTYKKSTSYESGRDGASSQMSDPGPGGEDKHTGWFRNHQYGPLLSKGPNLDDLKEDVDGLRSVSREHHHIEESSMHHPDVLRSQSSLSRGSMLSRSSIQLDDHRSYNDTSMDRESRSSRESRNRREDKGGLLVRSLSQNRDLGYHSMRKEVPFQPPERFERSLSETRPYHSMTNLDSTMDSMKKKKSRSRTRRTYQRSYGLNAGKELGVKSALSATDLSQPDVSELGVMAYTAGYHKAKSSHRSSTEASKPAKVEWGKCARISMSDIVGAKYSEEVSSNTKGLVTYKGIINEPIIVRIHIINDRAIATDISAQVDAPGESVPISLKKISDNTVEASVLPLNEGIHTINVSCRGDLIVGCPIRIMVMADESSFPENVRVGKITTAVVGEELQFQVDVAEAGRGELTVTISNGHHELPVRLEQHGAMFTIFTIADAIGDYNVNIIWDRSPVTDEPAKLRVYDPSRVTVSGDGLTKGREGTPARFIVDPRNAGFAELKVSVEGPNSIAKVTVERNEDKTYTVTYVPTEVGIFSIKVQYGGRPIYGAPFRAKISDPRKVRFAGFPTVRNDDGSMDFYIKHSYRIELETEDAGPGEMRAEMETANAILPLQVDEVTESRHAVIFAPPKEGKCVIRVRWAGSDIKGSPFVGYAREKEIPIDHTKVRVRGEGISRSKVYVPSEFIIDGSEAGPGKPRVDITGPSEDVRIKVEQVRNMDYMYKVTYMAERAGTYVVNVAWSERQIPSSPFKVIVEAKPHADRVRASSMKGLIAHQTCKVLIDTRDAAEGDLTAKCKGPTREAEVYIGRNEEGMYQLLITPREAGMHRLDVLYGNEHIQGSPFDLRVSAPPDASRVMARGPGLNHGIIDDYNGRFICETKGAGPGQLKVRVHGPKGAFKVKMTRGSKKDRTIDVRYNPTEVGEYKVEVKWSDEDVPGSPFVITVVDNEDELRVAKRENPINPRFTSLTTQGEWVEDL